MRLTALALILFPLGALAQDPAELDAAKKKLAPAPGLAVELWASEPMLQNPVAIAFDEQGRCYVAECHRRHTSTLDIHMRKEWLDDDLACRRHEDLVAYHEKRLGEKAKEWMVESERIRVLEDKTGSGRATDASTFSDGYRGLGEGIGAGILVRDGNVWYTCIPNLWHFKDGKRTALHSGFGVHLGASGHDMHGLRFGPDGKIYFSHGDRGFHVESGGKTFSFPDGGGVLRCNPDGSELEIVCVGLRNPQELAFDDYGNLFTGDNNISKAPDVGETCRWTYVVEGADFGWRIGYQFMDDGGAWCREEQWRCEAGFQVPFVARLGHGPSGVTHHPGVAAIPERYKDHFFMCDYPGGIWSFALKPKGASFEMVDLTKLVWEVNAPDVEIGNDGAVYVADWAGLWDKADKGRVWRLSDPGAAKDPAVAEVKRLIEEGTSRRSKEELAKLLGHADQRIRQNAQFELAKRGEASTLASMTAAEHPRLARIHAMWALGQLRVDPPLVALLEDGDPEIRAQAAKTLAGRGGDRAYEALVRLLRDESPRVRYFAMTGLGKSGKKHAIGPILLMLREKNELDPFLRHAAVMAMTWVGDVDLILGASRGPLPWRLPALVALRKLARPEVARFLEDSEPQLVLEAARAVYDTPIPAAMKDLSKLRSGPDLALLRAANACFRVGSAEGLVELAKASSPAPVRVEALRLLALWEKGLGRDRLMGLWRPVEGRDKSVAAKALEPELPKLVRDGDVALVALQTAGALGLGNVGALALDLFRDPKTPGPARASALRALGESGHEKLAEAVAAAVGDPDEAVAREGVRWLRDAAALEKIATADPRVPVRRAAIAALKSDEAMIRIYDAGLPGALQLDWFLAADKRQALNSRAAKVDLDRACLDGGDAASGRRIFFERSDVQCVRCHKIGGAGGEVGPDLSKIDPKKDAAYLLESILFPNKQIAEGYGQMMLQLANGEVEVGRVAKETDKEITLVLSDGRRKTVATSEVKARKAGLSAMPEDVAKTLSKSDLRDLVSFLNSLR